MIYIYSATVITWKIDFDPQFYFNFVAADCEKDPTTVRAAAAAVIPTMCVCVCVAVHLDDRSQFII